MSILSYKYKAHKFINYAFYVVVFLVGFLLGFASDKINYNKLISQILMIDNVSAYQTTKYTIDITSIDILPNDNNWIDSNYIYEFFNKVVDLTETDFSLEDYKYVVSYHTYPVYYMNFSKSPFDVQNNLTNMFNDTLTISYTGSTLRFNHKYDVSSSGELAYTGSNNSSTVAGTLDNIYSFELINQLDFSSYLKPKLEFNENLFKDNPDFKEVCVQEGKSFAITSTQMSDINSVYDYDYFWFPYNLNGLSKILYDNSSDSNEIHYTEEDSKRRYFYNTQENIDNFYSNDIPGLELETKGYIDKYSYYGWSAWPFRVYYSESYNQYNIFELKNPTKIYIGNLNEGGNVHGGGGTRLDGDEEIEISNEYCFYIKNIYEVTYVNVDEWGDYSGTVPTPNGDYEFNTSYNKLNSGTENFLNQPIKFINSMKDTINFINSLIYEFYLSLPLTLRTFIITSFIILIIILIMKIGGYK